MKDSKMLQGVAKNEPRRAQDDQKTDPREPKMAQNEAKDTPKRLQEAPKRPKKPRPSRKTKKGPNQDDPKTVLDRPRAD